MDSASTDDVRVAKTATEMNVATSNVAPMAAPMTTGWRMDRGLALWCCVDASVVMARPVVRLAARGTVALGSVSP
jgi:hypothetical protein